MRKKSLLKESCDFQFLNNKRDFSGLNFDNCKNHPTRTQKNLSFSDLLYFLVFLVGLVIDLWCSDLDFRFLFTFQYDFCCWANIFPSCPYLEFVLMDNCISFLSWFVLLDNWGALDLSATGAPGSSLSMTGRGPSNSGKIISTIFWHRRHPHHHHNHHKSETWIWLMLCSSSTDRSSLILSSIFVLRTWSLHDDWWWWLLIKCSWWQIWRWWWW